jgi:broad specificity phosphatase PhoE
VYALYVTHPQVRQSPAVPVPKWGLSDRGRARAEAFAQHPLVRAATRIVSSRETKALELAQILAAGSGAPITSDAAFNENDRTATGYVNAERFEQLADAFFAGPDVSAEGWETAAHAQARIVAAVEAALAAHDPTQPIVFAGHGAVGTLLKCALARRPIARVEDQRRIGDPGGGNVLVIRLSDRALRGDWTAMEQLPGTVAGL